MSTAQEDTRSRLQHALLTTVNRLAADIIRRTVAVRKGEFVQTDVQSKADQYVRDVFATSGAIFIALHGLARADEFIGEIEPTLDNIDGLLDTLTYHVENHYIRAAGLYDRALLLVNAVLDLGLHPRDATHRVLTRNGHVKGTDIAVALSAIYQLVDRETRNRIAHQEGFFNDEFYSLRMLEVGLQHDPPLFRETDVEEWVKTWLINFAGSLAERTEEFTASLTEFYNVLEPHFVSRHSALTHDVEPPS